MKNGLTYEVVVSLLGLIVVVLITGCSVTAKPIAIGVTELSACRGLDDNARPVGISKSFSADEKRIFACARLQTNVPITLKTHWYYEGKLVFTQVGQDLGEGYFYSFIEPVGESFPVGAYRIEIVIGNTIVRSTEFRVE